MTLFAIKSYDYKIVLLMRKKVCWIIQVYIFKVYIIIILII